MAGIMLIVGGVGELGWGVGEGALDGGLPWGGEM